MSDEATEDTGAVSENTEVTQETTHTDDKPAGYRPVDPETASPEEVKSRIDYLYGQIKYQERTNKEYRDIAQQQAAAIDELMNGVGRVVDHLQTKNVADTEAQITEKMQAAFESGDTAAWMGAQKQLIQLEAQKQFKAAQPKNTTQKQAYAGVQTQAESYVSDEDGQYTAAWQDEKDEAGRPLRPWARTSDPNDPDPDFMKALVVAKKVWEKYPDRSAKDNLAEVDRQMGVAKRNGSQSVMGGSLTTRTKTNRIVVSPQIEKMAIRQKFGGPKAKTDAEHIDAYRKQMELVRSTSKGSR